jgi:hypothetical protein
MIGNSWTAAAEFGWVLGVRKLGLELVETHDHGLRSVVMS